MELLARGANFEITAEAGVARLEGLEPPEVDREEGARCAQQINETLTSRVLTRALGVSRAGASTSATGPRSSVPKPAPSLEELFRAASSSRKRMAVRAGTSAIRRLQFASLCRECAPQYAKVVDDDREERAWLGGERLAART